MKHETHTSSVVYRQQIVIIVACTSTWLISSAVGLSQWLIVSETNTSTVVHIHTITSANKVTYLPRLVCWSPVSQQDYSSYSNRKCKKLPFSRTAAHIFVSPGDAPATCCMDGKTIQCLPNPSQHVPICLQYFPSDTMLKSMHTSKNRYFYHIFVSPGDAPGAITLNVVWIKREFDAYKSSRCMCPCPSNYNRFSDRARYWSKIVIFHHTPLHSTPR